MPSLASATASRARAGPAPGTELRCRVRLADGRVFTGALPAARHRALQLGCCTPTPTGSSSSPPGTRDATGACGSTAAARAEHFLPGGASGDRDWLAALLAHADGSSPAPTPRRPANGPARRCSSASPPRTAPRGDKDAVAATRWLWVDVDRPDRLDALWAFLAERPCHLLVESGGSGGVHAYWQLAAAAARHACERPRRRRSSEPIERAHLRLIHAPRHRRARQARRRRPGGARIARA